MTLLQDILDLLRCKRCGGFFHREADHCPQHPEQLDDRMLGCPECIIENHAAYIRAEARRKALAQERLAELVAEKVVQKLREP